MGLPARLWTRSCLELRWRESRAVGKGILQAQPRHELAATPDCGVDTGTRCTAREVAVLTAYFFDAFCMRFLYRPQAQTQLRSRRVNSVIFSRVGLISTFVFLRILSARGAKHVSF